MAYTVSAEQTAPLKLMPDNTVESILQNVRVIISTIRGDVPLDRGLGLRGRFVDMPMPAAQPILVTEVLEALEAYEPRARLASASFQIDEDVPGRMIPVVEVNVTDE